MNPKQKELLKTMTSLLRHLGIQVLLFGENYDQIEQIDYGFRKKMLKDFDYQIIADAIKQYIQLDRYYSFQDDLHLQYFLYRFPEEAQAAAGCQVLCIGPVLFCPLSQRDAVEILQKLNIHSHFHQNFFEFFNRIPLIPSYDHWNHTIGFFLSQCGFPITFHQLDSLTMEQLPSSDYKLLVPEEPDVAFDAVAERYQWENKIIAAVAAGDIQEALNAHYHFRQYRLVPRVPDPIRDRKNLMFTLNTLLRKAVEQAHVHPFYIDNLSRQFAIQIESACTSAQLETLPNTMLRKYCMLVSNFSRRSNSALIRNCLDYIDSHYPLELSLSRLAALHFVSPTYLSAQFKKEMGQTITDYINDTRIRQALLLLNASHLTIGEIASQCGFSDANYFTRTFKKLLGKTPKAYRQEIQA